MAIGLLGGTFDPPHYGHLRLAQGALSTGKIDRVILMPARIPPHKSRPDITPPELRLKMTELLAEEDDRLEVTDIEINSKGPSYTIDTVKKLLAKKPSQKLRLIIGADMALMFDSWKNAEELLQLAPPLIAARPGYSFPEEFGITSPEGLSLECRKQLAGGIFKMPETDVSSTDIRKNLRQRNNSGKLLPKNIFDYIISKKLYS